MIKIATHILLRIFLLLLALCFMGESYAQDTLTCDIKKPWLQRIGENKLFLTAVAGGPLLGAIAISEMENDKFRELRKQYIPEFSNHADDYIQYIPAIALVSMKAAGVKSRSSWGRMLVSDAMALTLVCSSVNIMKNNITYWRPDKGCSNSFPSGHTSNAFMMATMFAREYGYKSPWLTMGAYSIAATTGMMRMANNRHWMRDVLTGAGIGILSTEIGYLIADAIFKERGLNVKDEYIFEELERPSFISINVGKNIPLKGYRVEDEPKDDISAGNAVGIEGAYFVCKHLGVGGHWGVSSAVAVDNDNDGLNKDVVYYKMSFSTSMYYSMSFGAGLYTSMPLGNRWMIGSKLLCDYVTYPSLKMGKKSIPHDEGFGMETGASITFRARPNYGIRVFSNYNIRRPQSTRNEGHWTSLTCGLAFTFLCPQL